MALPTKLRIIFADKRGATAIEYGLICALIVIAMTVGLQTLGGGTMGMWGRVNSQMQNN